LKISQLRSNYAVQERPVFAMVSHFAVLVQSPIIVNEKCLPSSIAGIFLYFCLLGKRRPANSFFGFHAQPAIRGIGAMSFSLY